MLVTLKKTKNIALIKRLDHKIFGKEEGCEYPYKDVTWFLLVVDDKIAGFCGLVLFTGNRGYGGFLERSALLEPYRGHGLQKLMIKAREREAKRQGVPYVYTYTAHDNHASSNSLIKSGYKLYEPETKYGLKWCLYWMKKLTGDV